MRGKVLFNWKDKGLRDRVLGARELSNFTPHNLVKCKDFGSDLSVPKRD
jgi:hypothetical protein